jgi:hypothetical protein
MNPGRRAARDEFARRVNRARALLRRGVAPREVMRTMVRLYRVSPRQAHRYLDAAQQAATPWPVPESNVVFTVKVPQSLPPKLRQVARAEQRTLSEVVAQALAEFLQRRQAQPGGGGQER